MSLPISRRTLLKATTVSPVGYWLGTSLQTKADSPQEKLNLAVIGCGGRGGDNLNSLGSQNVIALCDVDDERAAKAYDKYPNAQRFADFRKLYDELGSKIDAVVISTPDHTHFHPAYMAIERGKHIYLEKPMAHNVWEVRTLTDLARERKLATQLGVQRHAVTGLRQGVELVQSGVIGEIKECHAWIDSNRGMPDSPKGAETTPATLNWDLWLGPTAERPYSKAFAPYSWRFWWDYGTGETGNFGCHVLDIPFWALDLKYPTRVEGTGPTPDEAKSPKSMATKLEFPSNDKRPAVTLHWYQGQPPILKELGLDGKGVNNLFIGDKGMLLCGFEGYRLLPADQFADFKPEWKMPKAPNFYGEWFEACKGGPAASCQFDYSGPLSETVLLANVAYRIQGAFDWDAATMKPGGNSDVEKYLREPYRKGWELG
jgi:predicted dehydrogenase